MLKKFNELSLKDKAYLIGGLILLVIVICFGLLNRQTVTVSLVFTQLSASLILVHHPHTQVEFLLQLS